jgi:hypothetical protein
LYPFSPDISHPIQRVFVEMQPLYATIARAPISGVLIYLVAAIVLVTVALRFRLYRGWEIMLLLGLTLLANIAVRAAQDWLLVMLALGVPHAVALLRQAALNDRKRPWIALTLKVDRVWKRAWNSPLLRFQWGWPALAATVLTVVSLMPPLSRAMPLQDADEWPSGATAFLKEHGVEGHFFGPSDYGAYVTWRLGDSARCYTDTRGFFFPPVLLEDSHYLPQLGADWQTRMDRVLDEYDTDYFLLETTGARGELWRMLRPAVGDDVVYLDGQSVVLTAEVVRRGLKSLEVARAKAKPSHAIR